MLKYYLYSWLNNELALKEKQLKHIPYKTSFVVSTEKPFKVYLCEKLKSDNIVFTHVFNSFIELESFLGDTEHD